MQQTNQKADLDFTHDNFNWLYREMMRAYRKIEALERDVAQMKLREEVE